MIRKAAASLVALVIAFGAVFAEEVKGTFVKFADGVLTIKVGDKEKEYKIPPDLKVKRKFKGEEKEFPVDKHVEEQALEGRHQDDSDDRRRQGDRRED